MGPIFEYVYIIYTHIYILYIYIYTHIYIWTPLGSPAGNHQISVDFGCRGKAMEMARQDFEEAEEQRKAAMESVDIGCYGLTK